MTKEEQLIKNQNIRNSMKATLERRSSQLCRVFTVKIQYSKLNKSQKEQLKMLFVEAKWLYNDILNYSKENNISTYNTKSKFVNVLNKDKQIEQRELKNIGSQMKQSVVSDILANLKGLKVLKEHGHKIGWLKFKSEYKSLTLKQFGSTYKIYNNHKMKIQGIKGKIYVNGLEQFYNNPNIEIANAKILNTPTGYYIAITTFIDKKLIHKNPTIYHTEIGIDMGIKTHITLSNGEKFSSTIKETEYLKRLQKKLSRQQKNSNNSKKTIKLIQKQYQKLTNRKNDISNKLVNYLLSYEKVYMQDEQISNWHKGLFGKQVQHSILGRVKAKLLNSDKVVVLDRFAPTTKYCPKCHNINKDIKLSDRTYKCPVCGYTADRDIHSANNMIIMSKIIENQINLVPMGHRDFKPVETNTSNNYETQLSSMVNEAGRLQPSGCN
jgi:putative transposase